MDNLGTTDCFDWVPGLSQEHQGAFFLLLSIFCTHVDVQLHELFHFIHFFPHSTPGVTSSVERKRRGLRVHLGTKQGFRPSTRFLLEKLNSEKSKTCLINFLDNRNFFEVCRRKGLLDSWDVVLPFNVLTAVVEM